MANPHDQITLLEVSLTRRFLPSIPPVITPDRVTWTEAQHLIDRLSRALAAYTLVGHSGLNDSMAVGMVTDGKNDGGIDALYFDRSKNQLVFVQAKYKKSGTAPAQDEVLKTINGIKSLQARRFNEFNNSFTNRLDEIEAALDSPGVQIVLILSFLGEQLGPHATADLNHLKSEMNKISPRMDWQMAGLSVISEWLIDEQTLRSIDVDFSLENWACVKNPRKAVYGQINAASLVDLVLDHGKHLFERNIRHYLGSVGVNTAIEETVRRRPKDFFYLNNGITAVAELFNQGGGNESQCRFSFKCFSIVNGAQTAGSIVNASLAGEISPEAKILISIIEIGSDNDDIGSRITKARNHQNTVRGVDFAALDPHQERLRQETALAGITYHYRPSAEARTRREDSITLEEAAVAIACLSKPVLSTRDILDFKSRGKIFQNAIDLVVTAKNEVGRLWEQEGSLYGLLFSSMTGVRLSRMVFIYRFIDQILAATEQSNSTYERRTFFRHGRFFVMSFIGNATVDLIQRSEFLLSEEDKKLLSQKTNEIAEMIYNQAEILKIQKGYLAFFRNLTDSQSLADAVIQKQRGVLEVQPKLEQSPLLL